MLKQKTFKFEGEEYTCDAKMVPMFKELLKLGIEIAGITEKADSGNAMVVFGSSLDAESFFTYLFDEPSEDPNSFYYKFKQTKKHEGPWSLGMVIDEEFTEEYGLELNFFTIFNFPASDISPITLRLKKMTKELEIENKNIITFDHLN